MQTETRTRAYRDGWRGRRRWYKCRQCNEKFQVDTRDPLPKAERICSICKGKGDCNGHNKELYQMAKGAFGKAIKIVKEEL